VLGVPGTYHLCYCSDVPFAARGTAWDMKNVSLEEAKMSLPRDFLKEPKEIKCALHDSIRKITRHTPPSLGIGRAWRDWAELESGCELS